MPLKSLEGNKTFRSLLKQKKKNSKNGDENKRGNGIGENLLELHLKICEDVSVFLNKI